MIAVKLLALLGLVLLFRWFETTALRQASDKRDNDTRRP